MSATRAAGAIPSYVAKIGDTASRSELGRWPGVRGLPSFYFSAIRRKVLPGLLEELRVDDRVSSLFGSFSE